MNDESQTIKNAKPWKIVTLLTSVVALAALVWGFTQWQRVNQLTLDLDTAHSTIAETNAKLAVTVAEANTKLTAAVTEANAKLSATETEANTKLSAASTEMQQLAKRDLPISYGFRPSLLGHGLVAEFKNNSGRQLEVAAVFSSESTGLETKQNLVLIPNVVKEFGANQGWTFVPGQHIKLSNENFRPIEIIVPAPRR